VLPGEFPLTHVSAVLALRSDDPVERQRSLERILAGYYKPVYKHLRVKWRKGSEDAEDLAQDFFTRATERRIFAAYEPSRGRFRTFVRACLDNFVLTAEEARRRQKRGGQFEVVSADAIAAERELALSNEALDPETVFDREWVRNVAARSVVLLEQRLAALDKQRYFEELKRYDLHEGVDDPSYATIAAELGLKVTDVTNYLHAARKELRAIVLDVLRELTATEDEFRAEAREVLGIEV
jgi:RNA polymerase sigma factor (sigma-70 family)